MIRARLYWDESAGWVADTYDGIRPIDLQHLIHQEASRQSEEISRLECERAKSKREEILKRLTDGWVTVTTKARAND